MTSSEAPISVPGVLPRPCVSLPLSAGQAQTIVARPVPAPGALWDRKRHLILHGPVLSTLLRLGLPTIGVLLAQTLVGVAETYWTGFLGTQALAGVALVFPGLSLMMAISNGGIGGGVSSAVARAVGSGRQAEADALVTHALVLAVVFGLLCTAGALLGGPALYRARGGTGPALAAALLYSGCIFAGSVPIWALNLLASAMRGAGEVALPALTTLVGAAPRTPLARGFSFGLGQFPPMGGAGAGFAVCLYATVSLAVLLWHLLRGRGALVLRASPLRWATFQSILGVGLVSALGSLMGNTTILLVTAAFGLFGVEALAGYGIASRLDWLLVPPLFGLGSAVVPMVSASIGVAQFDRARRVAWVAALLATAVTEGVGVVAAVFPQTWVGLFTADPAVLDAGVRYLRVVAPSYGAVGLGLMLYFACQGRGRMFWPVMGSLVRLLVAAGGSWILARHGGSMTAVLVMVACGSVAFATLNAVGMARTANEKDAAPDPHPRNAPHDRGEISVTPRPRRSW